MEIGKFKIVTSSLTLENLGIENAALKNRQKTLIAIATGSAILALIAYLHYVQIKKELKKNEVRIINPEDVR
jgi:hypothetical protein